MQKPILLARPHPFLVGAMKNFLEEAGFAVRQASNISEPEEKTQSYGAAVVSLALSSSVEESAEGISQYLRRNHPGLPLVFAALMPVDAALYRLSKVATALGIEHPTLLGVNKAHIGHSDLGRPGTLLYVSKEDLSDPSGRDIAKKLLHGHTGHRHVFPKR